MKRTLLSLYLVACVGACGGAVLGGDAAVGEGVVGEGVVGDARIAWHGTLAGGLAEARRTGRPILLVSGCVFVRKVPGVW